MPTQDLCDSCRQPLSTFRRGYISGQEVRAIICENCDATDALGPYLKSSLITTRLLAHWRNGKYNSLVMGWISANHIHIRNAGADFQYGAWRETIEPYFKTNGWQPIQMPVGNLRLRIFCQTKSGCAQAVIRFENTTTGEFGQFSLIPNDQSEIRLDEINATALTFCAIVDTVKEFIEKNGIRFRPDTKIICPELSSTQPHA